MPRYFVRITDYPTKYTLTQKGNVRPQNKYVLWSTMVDAPLCKITREEIICEIQFLANSQLKLSSLDGAEAVTSLQVTRDNLFGIGELTLEDAIAVYDELETFAEWKKTYEDN